MNPQEKIYLNKEALAIPAYWKEWNNTFCRLFSDPELRFVAPSNMPADAPEGWYDVYMRSFAHERLRWAATRTYPPEQRIIQRTPFELRRSRAAHALQRNHDGSLSTERAWFESRALSSLNEGEELILRLSIGLTPDDTFLDLDMIAVVMGSDSELIQTIANNGFGKMLQDDEVNRFFRNEVWPREQS